MSVARRARPSPLLLLGSVLLGPACGSPPAAPPAASPAQRSTSECPLFGGRGVDELIAPTETHFVHLWMLTEDGENAEAYWNFAGDRLSFQRRNEALGIACDRIFVTQPGAPPRQISNGHGVTTCAYFLPDGGHVLFASTQAAMDGCPPPIDPAEFQRLGYFWRVFPEHDIWVADLAGGGLTRLTDSPGYDAEATVSPLGDRLVFTSARSGDLELWTCGLDGSKPVQVTHTPGYDGGAFFSHDGRRLVFRSQAFTPGKESEEQAFHRELLAQGKVNPVRMELQICDADGTNRRAIHELGGASFAPYFFPGDARVIFSTNHHDPSERKREFDLFAVDVDGSRLEQITTAAGFDSFPMFSPDGRWLVFASNRGQKKAGDTNLFLAEWK